MNECTSEGVKKGMHKKIEVVVEKYDFGLVISLSKTICENF